MKTFQQSAVNASALIAITFLPVGSAQAEAQPLSLSEIALAMEEVINYVASLHGVEFQYALTNQTKYTPCGAIAISGFCPEDNTVYINVPAIVKESDNPIFPLFAAAHEAAHALQWNRGIGGMDSGAVTIGAELQADCMAGDALSWLFSEMNTFSKKEYEGLGELVGLAAAQGGDFDYSHAAHHGTPQQRAAFALRGYYGDDARVCLQ
jgi:predicted metalloprotease